MTGNPRSTKIEIAEALVAKGFHELRGKIPRRPARPAIGLRPRDRYWLHVFDALALAVAVQRRDVHRNDGEHGSPTPYETDSPDATMKSAAS